MTTVPERSWSGRKKGENNLFPKGGFAGQIIVLKITLEILLESQNTIPKAQSAARLLLKSISSNKLRGYLPK